MDDFGDDPFFKCDPKSAINHHNIVGTPLAEVFSIMINTNGEECALYGTVNVVDDLGTICIYDVSDENAEAIKDGGSLFLSNLSRAISASSGRFTVKIAPRDSNDGGAVFIDESFVWAEDDTDGCHYDACLEREVVENSGSACVNFIVHSVAVEAIIMIHVFDDNEVTSDSESARDSESNVDDEDYAESTDIHGTICVCYNKKFYYADENQRQCSQILVLKNNKSPVTFSDRRYKKIVLARPIVAVPSYSSLSIHLQLYDIGDDGNDTPLLDTKIDFPACSVFADTDSWDISTGRADIRILVRWLHHYCSLQTLADWRFMSGLNKNKENKNKKSRTSTIFGCTRVYGVPLK